MSWLEPSGDLPACTFFHWKYHTLLLTIDIVAIAIIIVFVIIAVVLLLQGS